ncbi:putative transmembrane protein INAFM2 isoform X2 [Poecilia latipinna]|uniref:putative transmembrane protein INAFM2 isoform X2 n=1 Tax=Poecilia latipinna TaxID=48699 RepID=UPI00072DECA2|nr:PREDICTED: putative transmembrane protein INAFM2 isoform X2 [Poecilia latipinna]
MKAVGRQVRVSSETPNGDTKRRPSYPGELRAKHANMSAKIWVKVAMAIAYFFSVSVAAFILAIYYAFFWKSNSLSGNSTRVQNRTECVSSSG